MLAALNTANVSRWEMTDPFVFIELLYSSALGGEMWLKEEMFCIIFVQSLRAVETWLAQLRYNLFISRSVLVSCGAMKNVEELHERR